MGSGGSLLGGRSVFTDEELESLRRFPEIGREELFRFFTLTPADSAFIDPALGLGTARHRWPDTPATDIRIAYACAD